MADRTTKRKDPAAPAPAPRRAPYVLLAAVCLLVIGLYAWSAGSGVSELPSSAARDSYYNLLVEGFRAGQLNLKRAVPSELGHLPGSCDPVANSPYWLMENQLLDLSYYKGELFLYFGVTPALVLFWPCVAVTGRHFSYEDAVVIFFSVGFLTSVGLVWALWRRYFAEVSVRVVAAGALAVGLGNFTLAILQRCEMYEVAISCGYALTMLALALVWKTMHANRARAWWLAGASLAYGLAVGARPSLLLGAVILLVPALQGRSENLRRFSLLNGLSRKLLLAATGPITAMGLGLLLYNYFRFENPFDFGWRYQLSSGDQHSIQPQYHLQPFGLHFLWFNFQVYFLEPAWWSAHFPFVHNIRPRALPAGYGLLDNPFGVLVNIPFVWLAFAAPLAWCGWLREPRSELRWFGVGLVLAFGSCALTLGLFFAASIRYQMEFLPVLLLLSVMGILGLERALVCRPGWRRAARFGWVLLLAFSVSFNGFKMLDRSFEACLWRGAFSSHLGRMDEAMAFSRQALKLQPHNPEAHNGLGTILLRQGRVPEGISHLEEALQLKPDYAEAHINLGAILFQLGRMQEAIAHLDQAVRLEPEDAEAHSLLGRALFQQDRVLAAISHLEAALRLKPEDAEACNNLGLALSRQGRNAEAATYYRKALALDPQLVPTLNNLALALAMETNATIRNLDEAVRCAERACALTTNQEAGYLYTLGVVYSESGRFGEAARAAQAALALAQAAGDHELAAQIESRLKSYQARRPDPEPTASQP